MSENYKAGTVAMATVRGVPNVRVFRYRDVFGRVTRWDTAEPIDGVVVHPDDTVTDVRPLVVLDIHPNAPAIKTGSLVRLLRDGYFDRVADQIEEQVKPSKPDEPTGLGAVVEDFEGKRWSRTSATRAVSWCRDNDFVGGAVSWELVPAVRKLSDGVPS